MATVIIPTPLRKFTNQTAKLEVSGGTVGEILEGADRAEAGALVLEAHVGRDADA